MAVQDILTLPPEIYSEEPDYYYDHHLTKEDLMGDSDRQFYMIVYMINLLNYHFQHEDWYIGGNMQIYLPKARYKTVPIEPDVVIFKGVQITEAERDALRSWKMTLPNRPAPAVVFEIASHGTWQEDLGNKKRKYRNMGVKEYFAYDPNTPLYYPERLLGWRYRAGKTYKIKANKRGWLWSEELSCWLGSGKAFLKFYDRDGKPRLTEGEVERAAKEQERAAKERAWAKLRELEIDPETL